jgi:DNA-binding MarR family transcriptional regulator
MTAPPRKKSGDGFQGTYGKFLETLNAPADKGDGDPAMRRVLQALAASDGKSRMKALLEATGLSPIQLVRTVESMKSQGLLSVATAEGDDVAELTPLGQSVAKLETAK